MMPKKTSLIAITLAATALLGAAAIAQTQSPAPSQLAPPEDPPGRTGSRGPGMGGEFGRGSMMGQGGMRGPWGPGMRQGKPGLSDADRAAFFEARLASIKAGLTLSESQLKFWPAVESSICKWASHSRAESQVGRGPWTYRARLPQGNAGGLATLHRYLIRTAESVVPTSIGGVRHDAAGRADRSISDQFPL